MCLAHEGSFVILPPMGYFVINYYLRTICKTLKNKKRNKKLSLLSLFPLSSLLLQIFTSPPSIVCKTKINKLDSCGQTNEIEKNKNFHCYKNKFKFYNHNFFFFLHIISNQNCSSGPVHPPPSTA
ncbi:hypothetical protein HanXRQr2_Chr06g0267331 [Helianthus annuus]|uniref:Uncharacterized protein n=1 Tax=Helianthus annuus TaxID=4232 RepID=A0A9K3IU67_HELAN|nr:hypothetical protein HanXRQr2_Chr06g0267331 [Helianthus annuus]